jgi:hypothetical protein
MSATWVAVVVVVVVVDVVLLVRYAMLPQLRRMRERERLERIRRYHKAQRGLGTWRLLRRTGDAASLTDTNGSVPRASTSTVRGNTTVA